MSQNLFLIIYLCDSYIMEGCMCMSNALVTIVDRKLMWYFSTLGLKE